MWRYLVGVLAGALLAVGGILWWKPPAVAERIQHLAGSTATPTSTADDTTLPDPPAATEKTREEKRFSRYDHDKNGAVSRDEYLAARHKAFAKLDTNNDGKLTFDEWAIKAETKFAAADKDKSGILTPVEFATTRVVRKTKPRVNCPPAVASRSADDES